MERLSKVEENFIPEPGDNADTNKKKGNENKKVVSRKESHKNSFIKEINDIQESNV